MRRFVWLFLIVGLAASAHAQRQPIPVGARVKLVVYERERQAETRLMRRMAIRGEMTAQSADSIWLRPTPLTGILAVPTADIRRIYESRGAPSRVRSFFVDGIGAAVAGAINCALFYESEAFGSPDFRANSRSEAAGNCAAWGFAVFSLVGAVFPVEYWRLRSINR